MIPEGIKFTVYDKVEPEPPIELADEGAKIAVKNKCDIVIGIGGGSAMDVAKAIAVLATNKGSAVDYLGLNKVPKHRASQNHDSDNRRNRQRSNFYRGFCAEEFKKEGRDEQPVSLSGTGAA